MAPTTRSRSKEPKTFAEFEKYRQELFAHRFEASNLNPMAFGLERTRFELKRLQQLVDVAEGIEGLTIKGRLGGWKRQLERRRATVKRFEILAQQSQNFHFAK
jgi:hypothetical protein